MDTLKVSSFSRGAAQDTATKEGLYKAEDLEVELDVTQSSKVQMQQLVVGVWDVVHTNADNVVWWNEDNGADLLIVLAIEGEPGQDLVVRSEIKGYEDLRGKPLAVDAAESGVVTPLRMLLSQAGLSEGPDYSFLEVGATQQRVDAMLDGRSFGAMVGAGRDLPGGMWVLDTINRLYTNYAGSTAVRRDWAAANGELLVRYLRAQLRAVAKMKGDGKAPGFSWDGLREMMAMRQDVGWLRGAVDPHRFADETFYRRALEAWAG